MAQPAQRSGEGRARRARGRSSPRGAAGCRSCGDLIAVIISTWRSGRQLLRRAPAVQPGANPLVDPADVPGSGGVAHRTPVDRATGRLRSTPLAIARAGHGLIAAVADRRTAHARPRGAGLSRGPVRQAGLRGVGRALVRGAPPARLQPAVPAARLAAGRAPARRAGGAGLGGAVRAAGCQALRRARRALGGGLVRGGGRGGRLDRADLRSRSGCRSRSRRRSRCARGRPAARGACWRRCARRRAPWRGCCSRWPA